MKFIYLDQEGNEVGPLALSALVKCVEDDLINPTTQIRNSMMSEWRPAAKIPSLKHALARQLKRWEENPELMQDESWRNYIEQAKTLLTPQKEKSTAFVRKYDPEDATVGRRLSAFAFDLILIGAVAIMLFGVGLRRSVDNARPYAVPPEMIQANDSGASGPARKISTVQRTPEGIVWYRGAENSILIPSGSLWLSMNFSILLLVPAVLLYYGLTVGYFAQSFGMWFWGIFLVREEQLQEVYFLRSFAWTVGMVVLGIFSPLCVFFTKRALHDRICAVRLINVAGKSKG